MKSIKRKQTTSIFLLSIMVCAVCLFGCAGSAPAAGNNKTTAYTIKVLETDKVYQLKAQKDQYYFLRVYEYDEGNWKSFNGLGLMLEVLP